MRVYILGKLVLLLSICFLMENATAGSSVVHVFLCVGEGYQDMHATALFNSMLGVLELKLMISLMIADHAELHGKKLVMLRRRGPSDSRRHILHWADSICRSSPNVSNIKIHMKTGQSPGVFQKCIEDFDTDGRQDLMGKVQNLGPTTAISEEAESRFQPRATVQTLMSST